MVRSVQDQLAEFRKSMEADGAAQRSECRRLVSTAVRRAGWLVDEVLQVYIVSKPGNLSMLSTATSCARSVAEGQMPSRRQAK